MDTVPERPTHFYFFYVDMDYDGYSPNVVSSDGDPTDVALLLGSGGGTMMGIAAVAMVTTKAVPLALWWRSSSLLVECLLTHGRDCPVQLQQLRPPHERCACGARPQVDAAVRLGLLPDLKDPER